MKLANIPSDIKRTARELKIPVLQHHIYVNGRHKHVTISKNCRDRCVADLDISGKGYSLNCSEYTEQEHVSCYICDVYYSFYKKEVL